METRFPWLRSQWSVVRPTNRLTALGLRLPRLRLSLGDQQICVRCRAAAKKKNEKLRKPRNLKPGEPKTRVRTPPFDRTTDL